jgi:hypothetical protein
MKRAEILLNLVIGICGGLISTAIWHLGSIGYSRLKKFPWDIAFKQFLETTAFIPPLILRTKFVLARITIIILILWYVLFDIIIKNDHTMSLAMNH